jgi:anti-anti-sigma regulatory factor
MTVFVTRRSGALVAIARSSAQHDPLPDLTRILDNLVETYDRIVLDLSGVTLAPPGRVAAFLAEVESHQHESGTEIALVANRPSARRLLRAMAADQVAVVSCLDDATSGSAAEQGDVAAADRYEGGALGTARPPKL